MSPDDTPTLTRRMAGGHEHAVRDFYARYFDWLLAQARLASGRDEAFCLDVVQDAMLRIVRSIRVAENQTQLKAWLKVVVRSVVCDHLRAESRRRVREHRAAGHRGESPDEASGAACDERVQWLRQQLRSIDPRLARLLELRYERRWSLRQIAETLGLTIGTVDGQLRRTLLKLRDRAVAEKMLDP